MTNCTVLSKLFGVNTVKRKTVQLYVECGDIETEVGLTDNTFKTRQ